MKTTLTHKLDNYLEKTSGMITILSLIGAIIGSLFALGMSSDYGITAPTSFGVVFFLVFFGSVLGALGAYIVAEKIGYANSAQVSRSLHKHYNNELGKVQAELSSAYTAHADTLDSQADYSALAHALTMSEERVTELTGQRDGYLAICNTNELLVSALRETHARKVRELGDEHALDTSSLVNLMKIALNPSDEDHNEAMADLQAFIPCMDDEAITRYAVARWNGEGYGDDDMNHLARYRETYGGYGWEDVTA